MARTTAIQAVSRLLSGRAWNSGAQEVVPSVPPIQQVAADARRLHRQLESLPIGTSFVRAMGVAHAYDQVLTIACQQLEVPTQLLHLPDGKPRILERIRLEYLLGECGLNI